MRSEDLITKIAPGAFCQQQEWDNRVDCAIKLPSGAVVGEMISLRKLSIKRLEDTADRLRRRLVDEHVLLVDEILPPLLIQRL